MKNLFLFLFLISTPLVAETPSLSVRGEASLTRPAELVMIQIGVISNAVDAASALAKNSESMQAVIQALQKAGLDSKEYQTEQFHLTPTYTPFPNPVPPGWRQTVNGYEVTNTLLVKTAKLEEVGKFIDAANKAGANSIGSISFALKDTHTYRQEAIQEATRKAMQEATWLAEASRMKLVGISQIVLDPGHIPAPRSSPMLLKAATPIIAGDLEVNATVAITYQIEPL